MAAIGNIPFASQGVYGRTSNTLGTGAGERLAQTTGGSAGSNKLWLPIWSGEVIRAYDHYRVFEPMVESRTISSGTTMEFPITGTAGLKTAWGAGEELVGNTDTHASKTIAVKLDARPIASHFELDNIDLMISQWEFRSELARQVGQTLANARDLQVGAYIVRAGVEALVANDPRLASEAANAKWRNTLQLSPLFHVGGALSSATENTVSKSALAHLGKSASSATNRAAAALALLECIEEFTVHLQEIGADTGGVYCAVNPQAFQDIRALGIARSSADLAGGAGRPLFGGVAEAGGLGAPLSEGMMAISDSLEYMGCRIIKTNHMPDMDATKSGYNIGESRYNLNFSSSPHDNSNTDYGTAANDEHDGLGVGALIWQAGCVASIQKTGLKVDNVDDVRRNTTFTVASMMSGTGVLRPELASVVSTIDMGAVSTGSLTDDSRAQARELLDMTAEYVNTT